MDKEMMMIRLATRGKGRWHDNSRYHVTKVERIRDKGWQLVAKVDTT